MNATSARKSLESRQLSQKTKGRREIKERAEEAWEEEGVFWFF